MKILIGLLEDIEHKTSAAVVGFIYSAALVHMFYIVFGREFDPGRAIKHLDFKSKDKIEQIKRLIHDFKDKDSLFELWQQMESKRNSLCYGYPSRADVDEYVTYFYKIKSLLEKECGIKLDLESLKKLLEEEDD